jgi:hypothetical protein
MGLGQTGFPAHSGFLRYSVGALEARCTKPPQLDQRGSIIAKTWEAPGSEGEFLPNRRLTEWADATQPGPG